MVYCVMNSKMCVQKRNSRCRGRTSARGGCLSNRILPADSYCCHWPTTLRMKWTWLVVQVGTPCFSILRFLSVASDFNRHACFSANTRRRSKTTPPQKTSASRSSNIAICCVTITRHQRKSQSHRQVSKFVAQARQKIATCNPSHGGGTIKSLQPSPDGLSAVILKADRNSDSPWNPVHESINESVIYSLVDNDPWYRAATS
jgi:hypothetical protein